MIASDSWSYSYLLRLPFGISTMQVKDVGHSGRQGIVPALHAASWLPSSSFSRPGWSRPRPPSRGDNGEGLVGRDRRQGRHVLLPRRGDLLHVLVILALVAPGGAGAAQGAAQGRASSASASAGSARPDAADRDPGERRGRAVRGGVSLHWSMLAARSRPPRCERALRKCAAWTAVTYERRGAAALVTIDRQERRNAIDGPTAELLADGLRPLRGRRRRARAGPHRRGRRGVLRRRRPQGDRELRARGWTTRAGPLGFTPRDLAEADDRRDLRLVPGRRAGAGALVRPADRHRRTPRSASRSGAGACR